MKLWAICQIHYLLLPFKKLAVIYQQYKKQKKTIIFQRYFFSSLAFPPFHYHNPSSLLMYFPIKQIKTKIQNSAILITHSLDQAFQSWVPERVRQPSPCTTPVTTNQNNPRPLGVLSLSTSRAEGVMRGPAVPECRNTPEGTQLSYTICCQYICKKFKALTKLISFREKKHPDSSCLTRIR